MISSFWLYFGLPLQPTFNQGTRQTMGPRSLIIHYSGNCHLGSHAPLLLSLLLHLLRACADRLTNCAVIKIWRFRPPIARKDEGAKRECHESGNRDGTQLAALRERSIANISESKKDDGETPQDSILRHTDQHWISINVGNYINTQKL